MSSIRRTVDIKHILTKAQLPISISISVLTLLFTVKSVSGFIPWMVNGGDISWLLFSVVIWIELFVAFRLIHEPTSQVGIPQAIDVDTTSAKHFQNTTEKDIDDHLVHFDIFISKPKTFFFKYGYLIFVFLFAVDTLQILFLSLFMGHVRSSTYDLSFVSLRQLQLILAGTGLILWSFSAWREQMPKILASMYKDKHLKGHEVAHRFLQFLNEFHAARRKSIMNLIPISIIVFYAPYYYYDVVLPGMNFYIHNNASNIAFVVSFSIHMTCIAFIISGCLYCIGTISAMLYISGRYISILAQRFKFNIEPLHPDGCGGLRGLGNLCFTTASPIFVGSAFFIGFLIFSVPDPQGGFDLPTVTFILCMIIAYGLFVSIFVLFLPLWDIHHTMRCERDADDKSYVATVEDLRLEIQQLLKENNTDKAKMVKEKMDLTQASHASYPRWSFKARSQFLTSTLAIFTSLLLGFLGAFAQPLVQMLLHYKP